MPFHKPVIPFIDQHKQYEKISDKLKHMFDAILTRGHFILGEEVAQLEAKLKAYVDCYDAITVANGTDAITLALMARQLKPHEVVFVPEFTYCATAGAPARLQAQVYFVDVDPHTYTLCPRNLAWAIEDALAKGWEPKGVIAVDLFGIPADYDAIKAVIEPYGLWLIADSAQAFGTRYHGRSVSAHVPLVTTSFYPSKPLGGYGDGGAVFVQKESDAAELIRSLRVHGQGSHRYDHVHLGFNSRLDTLQAAVLLLKLELFDKEVKARHHLASLYDSLLDERYVRQRIPAYAHSVYAQYTLRLPQGVNRAAWQSAMQNLGIPTMVYYPKVMSQQTAYTHYPTSLQPDSLLYGICDSIVALPMHAYMDEETTMYIIRGTEKALKLCS